MKRLPYPEPIELEGKYAKAPFLTPNNAPKFDTDASIKWMQEHADECDKVLDTIIEDQERYWTKKQG